MNYVQFTTNLFSDADACFHRNMELWTRKYESKTDFMKIDEVSVERKSQSEKHLIAFEDCMWPSSPTTI